MTGNKTTRWMLVCSATLLIFTAVYLSGMGRRPADGMSPLVTDKTVAEPPVLVARTVRVDSIEALQAIASQPNLEVTIVPGTYWLKGPAMRPSPSPEYPVFLDLNGSASSYDFSDVTIKVKTSELKGYGRKYGHGDTVRVLQVSGDHTKVKGLTLEMVHDGMNGVDRYGMPRQFTSDWSTTLVELIGDHVRVEDCDFTTSGSYPYGYGDAFGKGGRPAGRDGETNAAWIDHRKQSGIRIGRGARGVSLENVTLNMRSFGHGIFMQEGASDILLKNCAVLGDSLARSNDVIAHPEYQKWGFATYRQPIPKDIFMAKHEDGIRVYGPSKDYGRITNVTIVGCRIERMRDGLATGDMEGALIVKDTEVYGCEQGFTPSSRGSNLFSHCKGDAVNGPLVFFRRSANNVEMEVELAGESTAHGTWPIALISGYGNYVTLTSSVDSGQYPNDAYVMLSQHWREWRHRPRDDIDARATGNVAAATRESTIFNHTNQLVILGVNSMNNEVISAAGIYDKGTGNRCQGPMKVPEVMEVFDTWGSYRLGQ